MSVVVASIPSGHVYVRHLQDPGRSERVVRLPDPAVANGNPAAQWWPPAMLEPDWVRDHADEFDVMHVHFGFDHQPPATLRRLGEALRHHRKPLVLTVHDLRNPHHQEPELHDAQLGVLVECADAVITLTPGAAEEIRRRWGRTAHVLPHPHVVEEPRLSRPRREHPGFVIGVHVKSLRANMDPMPVIEQIVDDLSGMPGAVLRVDAHTDVMDHAGRPQAQRVSAGLARLAAAGLIDLHVHDYFTDDELWDYLSSLDVSVLPYRFGTHSGWLEACFDLGTVVLAPDCGYYSEQRPCITYALPGTPEASPEVPTLTRALRHVHEQRPSWRADPVARKAERQNLARAHEEIYAAVLTQGAACTS
jgi:glycosyltransferase involved in cell wall biosynthesis